MEVPQVVYEFASFRLDPARRLLERDGRPVTLPPRLTDALLLLVRGRDRLLTKEEFFRELWPDTIVDENNLSQTVSALRKVLGNGDGARYIETIPKHGYRFVAAVREVPRPQVADLDPPRRRRWTAVLAAASAVALMMGAVILARRSAVRAATLQVRSLAVLPLKPIGPTAGRDYLGLGLADGLIMRLGYIHELAVRPTSAVRPYASSSADPIAAGRSLGVDAVLDGTYQLAGTRLRVNLRLLHVPEGSQVWASTFDVPSTDTFSIEDSVGDAVAANLRRTFTEPKALLARRGTTDPAAYDAYIRGRYHWNKRTPADLKLALEWLQKSIERDPQNPLAWSALADTYALIPGFHLMTAAAAYPQATAAAEHALRLDPGMSQAHATLGYVKLYYDWDWNGARRELQTAVDLDPNNAVAHHWLSDYLMVVGRDGEAVAEIDRARQLDPLSLMINTVYGTHLLYARRYDQAIAQIRHTLSLDPDFAAAHLVLGMCYEKKRMLPEAIAELRIALKLSQNAPYAQAYLAQAEASTGDRESASKTIEALRSYAERERLWPFGATRVFAALGQADDAFASIQRSYDEKSPEIIYVKRDPTLDALRSDARYTALLRRMRLE